MILQIPCIKCSGQVVKRDGLDGEETVCLNCGFGQTPNIIPTQALADDSEDYQLRNRSDGWSDTYYDLRGIRSKRGRGKTNRLGYKKTDKKLYELKNKPKQLITKQTIDTWNRTIPTEVHRTRLEQTS